MTVTPTTVEGCMTRNPVTLPRDMEINRAAALLIKRNISGAPVVDESGRVVGVLTAKDCFRAVLHASYHQDLGGTVATYMTAPAETVDADLGLIAAAELFLGRPYRRFPVMKDGRLVGIVTRLDLLRAFSAGW